MNHRLRHTFICGLPLASLSAPGCVHSDRVTKATALQRVESLEQLTGLYENQGTTPSASSWMLMTDLLFPEQSFPKRARVVRVSLPTPTVLRCEAIRDGQVLAAKDFVHGRDFKIADGRIPLGRDAGVVGLEPGSLALGVGTGGASILLAANGDAILSGRGSGAVLLLLVVPAAFVVAEDYVFPRIENESDSAFDWY